MARDKSDQKDVSSSATSKAQAMNECGIPDWQDSAAYPADPSDWTTARWLWEFTRRRADYREETLLVIELVRHVEDAHEKKKVDKSPDAKCSFDTLYSQFDRTWRKHWKRWGYSDALDPRVSEYPQDDLLRWPHGGISWTLGSPLDWPKPRNSLTPDPAQMAITINLDRPLEQQLAMVAQVAKEQQRERHGKVLERRRHHDAWPTYIRALDARESGATLNEMAFQFYQEGILDRRRSEDGTWGSPPPQAARRLVEAGKTLQFNFPD